MSGDESGREPSFKVQDRRRFSASGEAREEAADETPAAASTPESEPTAAPDETGAIHSDAESHAEASQEITFASFVFSLSTQVLVHLGEVPDPIDGSAQVNLEAARQMIDILAILREKTRGNLDPAENSLLENALYDLRMRYVDRARER